MCVHCVSTVCPLYVHCEVQAKLEGAASDKQKHSICKGLVLAVQRAPDTNLLRVALKAWLKRPSRTRTTVDVAGPMVAQAPPAAAASAAPQLDVF